MDEFQVGDDLLREALYRWEENHNLPTEERMRRLLEGLESMTTDRALRAVLPACPGCGCVTPDRNECGCDEGCAADVYPPGVNVLIKRGAQ